MSSAADFQVRQLAAADLEAMRALNRLYADVFEDPDSYASAPPTDHYLSRALGRESNIVLVTELDGEVIGGLVAYELEKFEQARSEIYIYDIAVAEAYWRRGIATALVNHLQHLAKARGAWVIYVQADYVDPPAIALYEKLGRREEVLHFDIDPA